MRNVGIKELKNQASHIVNSGETVIIEKYGRPVGLYIPLGASPRSDKMQAYQLAENVGRIMAEIAAQNGLTPDELADELERLAHSTPDEAQAS